MLGLIGRKVGMTQVFDDRGDLTPVTVIRVDPNTIVSKRSSDKNGYTACVIGSIDKKTKRVTKPYAGQFPEGMPAKRFMLELRDVETDKEIGDSYGVEIFEEVSFVDVIGKSKGKGFQGVMKRHGFGGGRSTHGSKFHRANGSTGMAATPSKVHKGTKMAGRMGSDRKTVQNLRIVKVDTENQLLLIKGAVPGTLDSMVLIRKAVKK